MNQIKKARQLRAIPQNILAEKMNITQQAISRYENGTRTPDDNTWEKLSQILQVPVQYLQGKTSDPDGWDVWESSTGYSIDEIKKEIERMKIANHIVGDPENLQNLIGQAVANISGNGNTDRGIIENAAHSIMDLQNELTERYYDPAKIDKLPKIGTFPIFEGPMNFSDYIYDDLNAEAYEKAIDILLQARRDLQAISNDLGLK